MNEQTITIQKYKTRIWNSVLEQLHGDTGRLITEFFIPKHNLCFNTDTGRLNVFYYDTRRANEFEEVEMSENQVNLVKDYYDLKTELYDLVRMYQNNSLAGSKMEEEEKWV